MKTKTPQVIHGKLSTYCNRGCRCVLCKKAAQVYARTRRRRPEFRGTKQYPWNDTKTKMVLHLCPRALEVLRQLNERDEIGEGAR